MKSMSNLPRGAWSAFTIGASFPTDELALGADSDMLLEAAWDADPGLTLYPICAVGPLADMVLDLHTATWFSVEPGLIDVDATPLVCAAIA